MRTISICLFTTIILFAAGCRTSRCPAAYEYDWGAVVLKLDQKEQYLKDAVENGAAEPVWASRAIYVEELVRLRAGCGPLEAACRIGHSGYLFEGGEIMCYPCAEDLKSMYVLLFSTWEGDASQQDETRRLSGVVMMPKEFPGTGTYSFVWPPKLKGKVFRPDVYDAK